MLYDVLSSRACVNLLKILYDNEVLRKNSYSLKKSDILQSIRDKGAVDSAIITLAYEALILKEEAEGELHISITEKGKKFIALFDQLVVLMKEEEVISAPKVEIKYDLTDAEKRILLTLYQMQKETGKEISLSDLARELHPYEDYEKKKTKISNILTRLQEMNLAEKTKKERVVYASVTQSGEKVANSNISVRTV